MHEMIPRSRDLGHPPKQTWLQLLSGLRHRLGAARPEQLRSRGTKTEHCFVHSYNPSLRNPRVQPYMQSKVQDVSGKHQLLSKLMGDQVASSLHRHFAVVHCLSGCKKHVSRKQARRRRSLASDLANTGANQTCINTEEATLHNKSYSP